MRLTSVVLLQCAEWCRLPLVVLVLLAGARRAIGGPLMYRITLLVLLRARTAVMGSCNRKSHDSVAIS